MNSRPISVSAQDYPKLVIRRLGDDAPSVLHVAGRTCLSTIEIALMCSVRCPGSVIIKTLDAIRDLRDSGVVVAGGFHSPIERDCLHFLLRGSQQVVLSPAHAISALSLGVEEQAAFDAGRLTVVSMFGDDIVVASPRSATMRNQFVAVLADILLVPYAVPGGKVASEVNQAISRGHPDSSAATNNQRAGM